MLNSLKKSKQFKTKIFVLQSLMGMHCLLIPAEIVHYFGGKFSVRLLCRINEFEAFQCGLVSLGKGEAYISINKKRMKAYNLVDGDIVEVVLELDESEYGMTMAEELEEILFQDEEGYKRFQNLSPGKQRYIIHYVNAVKSSQLRIDRALLLINNLKNLPEGKESFRGMLGLG